MISQRKELEASWARTRTHLENAFGQLPPLAEDGEEGGSVQLYREWLDHNELGLALDELEMLGEVNCVSTAFWGYLLEAAKEMKLSDRAARYQEKIAG